MTDTAGEKMSIISDALKKIQEQRSDYKISAVSEAIQKVNKEQSGPLSARKAAVPGKEKNLFEVRKAAAPVLTREPERRKKAFPVLPLLVVVPVCVFLAAAFYLLNHGGSAGTRAVAGSGAADTSKRTETHALAPAGANPAARQPAGDEALPPAIDKELPDLQGIMYSPSSPKAVVNGQIVQEGDIVDGFTIIRITPDAVKCDYGGQEHVIKLR